MKRDDESAFEPPELVTTRLPWDDVWSVSGVTELLEPMVSETRRKRIADVIDGRIASVTLLMDAPHDPHNGAAIIRSCDAFGVQRVHVVPREESFQLASRVTKGTDQWVDVTEHESPSAAVERLTSDGFEIVATHPDGELAPEDLAPIERLALLVGNEHDGIRDALARSAKRSVRIPMRGFVESLNVSVSAAILLAAATKNRPGDLADDDKKRLFALGLYRTVARAGQVLCASEPR